MQLLNIPSDIYSMITQSTLFVSLPPVNSWYQEDGMKKYIYGEYLG